MTVKVKTVISAVDATREAFDSVNRQLGSLKKAFGAVGAGLGVAAFGEFLSDSLQAADVINKLSDRLGVTTEALSEYKFVAEQTGVGFRNITDGFQKLGRRVSEAAKGTGEARKVFAELGIEASAIKDLAIDQQFEIIADAIGNVENATDKLRIAQKLFDSNNVKLLTTLKGGSAELRKIRQEARDFGLTLDGEAADGASRALDAWNRLAAGGKALSIQIVNILGPTVADVVEWFGKNIPDAIKVAGRGFDQVQIFIASVASKITGVFAKIDRAFAAGAEFVGADKVAKVFRAAAKEYDQVTKNFVKVVERLKRTTEAENRANAIRSSLTFQEIYNKELAKAAGLNQELTESIKARATEEERAEERRQKAIAQYLDDLQTEVDTLGLSSGELVEYELAKLNATEATIEAALALQEEKEAFEAIAAVERENEEIFKRSAELQKREMKEVRDEVQDTGDSLATTFADAIEGADSFKDALDNVKDALISLAAQQIKDYFADQPGTGAPQPGAGGGLFGLIKNFLPGFQHGGRAPGGRPILVGEGGPEVLQLGQSATISPVMRIQVDVSGGDPFANAASQSQFAHELGNSIATQMSRNG